MTGVCGGDWGVGVVWMWVALGAVASASCCGFQACCCCCIHDMLLLSLLSPVLSVTDPVRVAGHDSARVALQEGAHTHVHGGEGEHLQQPQLCGR